MAQAGSVPANLGSRLGLGLVTDPLGTMIELGREGRGLDHRRIGHRVVALVADPAIAHEVLVRRHDAVSKGGTVSGLRLLLGDGLVTSDGPRHRDQRRALLPAFGRGRLGGYGWVVVDSVGDLLAEWRSGETRSLDEDLRRSSTRIAARSFLGVDPGARTVPMADAIGILGRLSGLASLPLAGVLVRSPIPPARRFRRARCLLEEAVASLIVEHDRRRTDGDHEPDALCLIEQTERGANGVPADGESVRRRIGEQAMTVLVAGTVTVAASLAWTLLRLARSPSDQAAVQSELDAVLGDRLPTADDAPRLPITRAAYAEAMRLHPPAWAIGRTVAQPFALGDLRMSRGAVVVVSPLAAGRDPRLFKDADRYDLGRWLGRASERAPAGFIPFGAGPRRCPGDGFAWQEGVLTLAMVLRSWNVAATDGSSLEARPDVTLTPADGGRVVVDRRSSAALPG